MSDRILDNWQVQIRKGLLELCILTVLNEGRKYGYDIIKHLRSLDGLVIGEGTIYPILSRFRNQGLVEASIEESPEGPARKYYSLTAAGRECLTKMTAAWERIEQGLNTLRAGESDD